MVGLLCRGVVVSCFVLLISTFFDSTQAAPSPQDYQNLADIYDWYSDHAMERREVPSMRLRFGKRDNMRGMWTVAQRSMPSLRLRFGKRDGAAGGEQVAWDEPEVERRAGDRSPALRLRFGKRGTPPDQQDILLSSSENH